MGVLRCSACRKSHLNVKCCSSEGLKPSITLGSFLPLCLHCQRLHLEGNLRLYSGFFVLWAAFFKVWKILYTPLASNFFQFSKSFLPLTTKTIPSIKTLIDILLNFINAFETDVRNLVDWIGNLKLKKVKNGSCLYFSIFSGISVYKDWLDALYHYLN